MKSSKSKRTKYIVMIVAVLVIGVILAVAFSAYVDSGEKSVVRSEVSYFILALLIALPVCMLLLLIALAVDKKEVTVERVETVFDGGNLPQRVRQQLYAATASLQYEGKKKDKGGEDEERSRFCMLCTLDANRARYQRTTYDDSVTLKRFCEEFRNFACSKLKLYYSIDDIRRFIAGLAVTKIIILQGMSGTGKTSLAYAFGEFLENKSTVVPVQPMWKERTDLVGYYNEFTKRFNETTLLQKMYEANYSKDIYITILDEMNIARVEYYFAEFLSLLELPNPDRRYLDVVSDEWPNDPIQLKGGQIKLPNNMWFIGTANNDDSTFAIERW